MAENGQNMAGSGINRNIKKPAQAPGAQAQAGGEANMEGQAAPGQDSVDPSQKEGAQNALNQPQPEVPDFSYMDSFAEAFRQAKGSGATVFRWKPDRFGNDTYSTGIQDNKTSNPAEAPQGPGQGQQAQQNPNTVDTPTGEEGAPKKSPGIMSKMVNKIMGK